MATPAATDTDTINPSVVSASVEESSPPSSLQSDDNEDLFDISVHLLPKQLEKDVRTYVLTIEESGNESSCGKARLVTEGLLKAIPIMIKSRYDLVRIGPEIEEEKNRLLEQYLCIAKVISKQLLDLSFWADYMDPCSGLPVLFTSKNGIYDEVSSAQTLLGYAVHNAGCCKIMLHPDWGSSVYPSTIFTTAPAEIICEVISKLAK